MPNAQDIKVEQLLNLREPWRILPAENIMDINTFEMKGPGFKLEVKIKGKWIPAACSTDFTTCIQTGLGKMHNAGYINLFPKS